MPVTVEQLQQKLDALRKAGQQSADFGQMQEQITNLQASASSSNHSVTVTAGPNGTITDVQFTQEALRGSPSQLSSTVMSTLREAVAEVARKQATIVQEHTGDGEILERVMRTQEEMFGTTIERPQSSAASDEVSPDYYDDFADNSFYDRRSY